MVARPRPLGAPVLSLPERLRPPFGGRRRPRRCPFEQSVRRNELVLVAPLCAAHVRRHCNCAGVNVSPLAHTSDDPPLQGLDIALACFSIGAAIAADPYRAPR